MPIFRHILAKRHFEQEVLHELRNIDRNMQRLTIAIEKLTQIVMESRVVKAVGNLTVR